MFAGFQNPNKNRNVAFWQFANFEFTFANWFAKCYYCYVEEVEKISKREFARRIGVSDTAVRKAIKAGKIVKGFDPEGGRESILFEIALREYSATHNPAKATLKRKPKPIKSKASKSIDPAPAPEPEEAGEGQTVIDFNTSRAKKMQYEAKIKRLEYEEKTGKLVDRESVYKGLFQIGKEFRNTMQALPDRVIDDIMASTTRNEGHAVLVKALNAALQEFSDAGEVLERHILKNTKKVE